MNNKEIESALKAKFNKALRDGEIRKIVYWIDTECAFEDVYESIEIDSVLKYQLVANNFYKTKYMLEEEYPASNILIYTNEDLKIDSANWLLDSFLYADQFYADEVSLILHDFDFPNALREVIRYHKKFFKSKERYNRLKRYQIEGERLPDNILKAMICAICGIPKNDFDLALRKLLRDGFDENKVLSDVYNFVGEEVFWYLMKTEYGFDLEEHSLKKLAIHLMITAMSFNVDESVIESFSIYKSKRRNNDCRLFIDRWIGGKDKDDFESLALLIENEIMFNQKMEKFPVEEIVKINLFPSVDKMILLHCVNTLKDGRRDFDNLINLIREREVCPFYEKYRVLYNALFYFMKILQFKDEKAYLLNETRTEEWMKRYVDELNEMDYFYRKFYENYDVDNSSEMIKKIRDQVEDIYNNWFLNKLSVEFSDSLQSENDLYSLKIRQQEHFFDQIIDKHMEGNDKVFVIISDALRYEVGVELYDKILVENNGLTSIEPMLSVLPSATKFGMAALLPHKAIEYKEGSVSVDGLNTSGLKAREKVLKTRNTDSVVFHHHEIINMKRDELERCTVGKKLIYIYHDTIDALGDKSATEMQVFEGCTKAVDELSSLLKLIVARMGGTNIYITSDHGFIYVRDRIQELDKAVKKSDCVEIGRRYAISKDSEEHDGLIRVGFNTIESNRLSIYSPKDNRRFKIQGGGANYVHGGISLHEMIIPLISYKHKRSHQKGVIKARKTELKLASGITKVTNSLFTLSFYQTQSVGEKVLPIKAKLYFIEESGEVISNEVIIQCDIESSEPKDRTLNGQFYLKAKDYDRNKNYYLVIKDDETDLELEKVRFVFDLAFSNDFDF